ETFVLDEADLVIDALFGAGLARDLDGEARMLVERVNAWRLARKGCVVAVDVPSGVDGTTGAIRGSAIEADATVTFFRLKPGHLLMPGRAQCGTINCAQIGIKAEVLRQISPQTFWNVPEFWRTSLPVPRIDAHKYARGHALVVSGGLSSTGAARLAARGALRAGAGLVTLASPGDALAVNAAALTAVMVRSSDGPAGLAAILADARKNAVVLGPGLGVGEATCALVETALASGEAKRACVLDADALTSFAGAPERLFAAIGKANGPVVLTPHAGEFARLFGCGEGSKLERTREAAKTSGAIVLFKGPDTVVAAPDGRATIASNAPAWLATAGSGDVLAGMICGLLAQGAPALEAASAAVWMHGEAANVFGPGLIAEDIPESLPKVWRALLAG
ncbi:MAG: NAD(P)H-hydrate dehydratase, partial [Rhodoblastus sp.]